MKKLTPTLFLIPLHLFLFPNVNAQSLAWASQFKGTSSKIVEGSAVDGAGNLYTVGGFQGTVDFDPGPGSFNLTAPGAGGDDIFIVKQSADGKLLWVKQIGDSLIDVARDVTVNPSGYIEIVGDFRGTVDLDPGVGVVNRTAGPNGASFILRLTADGDFISVRQFGSTFIREIATDHMGNLIMLSNFAGTVDVDPGPGVINLTSTGSDIAICKYSPGGSLTWARAVSSTASLMPNSLTIDQQDNIIYGGYFYNTVDFDPGTGTANMTSGGNSDGFVSKLNSQGDFIWAKQFRNLELSSVYGVACDAVGDIYVSGFFEGTIDFDPGPANYFTTSYGDRDAFALKLSKDGNLNWASRFGGTMSDDAPQILVGTDGAVYVSIDFHGTADFDPGAGVHNLTASGGANFAITKLSVSGGLDRADQVKSSDNVSGFYLNIDNLDNIYVTGTFSGTADFDPGPQLYNLTAGAAFPYVDIFTLKLSKSNLVTGTTFQDLNGDGIRQSNEPPLADVLIKTVNGNFKYYAISDSNGVYRTEVDTGSYSISPALPLYYTSIVPATHSANFGSLFGQVDTANHFGLVLSSVVRDLRIYITNLGPARPGRLTMYEITYVNKGTENVSGSVSLMHDSNQIYTSASPVADNYSAPVITWNFNNLGPSMSRSIQVELGVSPSAILGSFLKLYATVNPVAGDFEPDNNTDSLYHLVSAGRDPNDKKVNPSGDVGTDFITNGNYLDYTVRFQNTGNDTAFLIVVKDTLSTNVEVSSFEMLSASHPYSIAIHEDGIIEWRFANILLPDSNINEARSHGFVRYRVKPKNTLVAGSQIKNRASIYFDYNTAVVTNETVNTVNITTAVNPTPQQLDAKVFPNPARSKLYLLVKGRFAYYLYDINGEKIFAGDTNYDQTAIDVHALHKGIYFVEIKTSKGRVVKKIIVL
jgi:uncharacterized repeat protein (TIGR01451 family)